ncbi:MAG: alpha/beta fold hydrolase [Cyclobacteriaceae bacterium]|nr:alpha/beta fold hydrolase [Cyclobacteriaceae bacterium]
MPLVPGTDYQPPRWLFNAHLETIYPVVFRKIRLKNSLESIVINTADGDYFELDYYDTQATKTVIISHGLEGNSRRPYVLGMAGSFLEYGWNVVAWNYRGCNGKPNKTIKSYHSGFTEDLVEVIRFADKPHIQRIALVGFSLGGNLTLRYLGSEELVNPKICSAVVFSVPIDLHQSCMRISEPSNFLYSQRFLKSLKAKILEKAQIFHDINTGYLSKIHDLKTFDDYYTASLHGFRDALDYYKQCSAMYVLEQIATPTMIISAGNDPFLTPNCFPIKLAKKHQYVHLAVPPRGGHVGFTLFNNTNTYWSEMKALEFVARTG